MECNEDGSWWNPNALRMSWWRPLSYKSDEEIYREAILHGSGFAGGKKRIIDFFASEYDDKKRIEFLKNEYGVGGWTTDYGCVDHNAGGLDFSYKEEYKQANKQAKIVHSGWPMVAKEIEYLIQRGIYTADIKAVTESVNPEEEYKDIVNDYWHEVPGSMPTNTNWMPALFVLYNSKTKETHYNMPGEVKDSTFRRPKDSPEGEVIAWRYKL